MNTPVFLYVGERDVECPASQSVEYWHALRDLGTPVRLLILAGEGHAIREPDHEKAINDGALTWFDKYLGGGRGNKYLDDGRGNKYLDEGRGDGTDGEQRERQETSGETERSGRRASCEGAAGEVVRGGSQAGRRSGTTRRRRRSQRTCAAVTNRGTTP